MESHLEEVSQSRLQPARLVELLAIHLHRRLRPHFDTMSD